MRQDLPAWRYNHLAWCPADQAGAAGKGAVSGLSTLTKKLPRGGWEGVCSREIVLLPGGTPAIGRILGLEWGELGLARL